MVSFVNEQNFAAGPATNGLLLLVERRHQLAPELLRWKPPWMLGAILATGAVLVTHAGARGAKAAEAARVLAWVKPHVRRVHHLAGQIAIFADRMIGERGDVPVAAALFDLVVGTGLLSRPQYGNALYAVLSANQAKRVERALQQRVLRAALAHAGDDPSVRFNAACICMEVGKPTQATEHLLAALQLGAPPEHAKEEPLLRTLLDDPRIADALTRSKKPRARAPAFVAHGFPLGGEETFPRSSLRRERCRHRRQERGLDVRVGIGHHHSSGGPRRARGDSRRRTRRRRRASCDAVSTSWIEAATRSGDSSGSNPALVFQR